MTLSNAVATVAYRYRLDAAETGYTVTLANGREIVRIVRRHDRFPSRITLITNAVGGVEAQHYGMAYGFADGWSYTWDGENRLTSVAHNGSVVVSNRYDALHRRVQKITPAATTTFFYDGWNLLREVEVTAAGVTNRTDYYWGRDVP